MLGEGGEGGAAASQTQVRTSHPRSTRRWHAHDDEPATVRPGWVNLPS